VDTHDDIPSVTQWIHVNKNLPNGTALLLTKFSDRILGGRDANKRLFVVFLSHHS